MKITKTQIKIEDAAFYVMRVREATGFPRLPKTDLELATATHEHLQKEGSRIAFKTVLTHVEKRFY